MRTLCALAALLCAGLTTPAFAAPKDVAKTSAKAQITVLQRLSFIKTQDLDFGRVVPATTAGTLVLAPDGSRTVTGGLKLSGGSGKPAIFSGYGYYLGNVSIRIGANSSTLTRVGGTQTMTMDTFIIGSNPQQQLTTTTKTFYINATNGMFTFPLGATLRVGANQTPGVYTGTFTVTLDYL